MQLDVHCWDVLCLCGQSLVFKPSHPALDTHDSVLLTGLLLITLTMQLFLTHLIQCGP
jgi:hypothetical protein